MIIHLFGSTTLSGQALIDKASKSFPDFEIKAYSRSIEYGVYGDLLNPNAFHFSSSGDSSFLISFAPIWLFAPFLESLLKNQPEKLKDVKGIIACSSSSIITKRFATNNFDKNLVMRLEEAEKNILSTCEYLQIPCKILRPTLIYGQAGKYKDKNLSKIVRLMRCCLFLPIPSKTGLRQPIHSTQLAEVALTLIGQSNQSSKDFSYQQLINLGGDQEISYHDMLLLLQKALPITDKAKKCYFIPIPNRVFLFLASPLLLLSPKMFAAVERISSNLSGFTPSNKVLGIKPREFPLTPLGHLDYIYD